MQSTPFELKTSLVKHLRRIMVAIAVFFLMGFLGIYLSSIGFLDGMQRINNANRVFVQTSSALEALDSSQNNVMKLLDGGDPEDIKYVFDEGQRLMRENVQEAIKLAVDSGEVHKLLLAARDSAGEFEGHILVIFADKTILQDREKIRNEILVAEQFSEEAREGLRKAQITLRREVDSLFSSIYEKRFRPLIVAIVSSILFFGFVVTIGFSFASRLGRSISNLVEATETVARGDLGYEAPILEQDEIGQLTYAFNDMVSSLAEGRDKVRLTMEKIRQLQSITAAFSEALTVNQVASVTVSMTFETLGAHNGAIGLLTTDGSAVEVKAGVGYKDDSRELSFIAMTKRSPMTEVIRYGEPIFIETPRELHERFPDFSELFTKFGNEAVVSIPLTVGSLTLGALSFYFNRPVTYSEEDKQFVIALARQCAQAIHRSQLYDEAREAILARDEFLSIASHELKTPLTPLKLQLQMLARTIKTRELEDITPERMLKIMESSDKQLGRLSRLIEDLLDVSRITSGKLTLNKEKFDLTTMVDDVLEQYGHQLKKELENVEVQKVEPVIGEFDRVRMEQVLINLLTNAAKYAPGRPIKVRIQSRNGNGLISVTDQGPGVAKENQSRIFDRFERVRDHDNIGGLGLGLYISSQIIETHGGRIWVESEVGKGATFYVELPLRNGQEIHPMQ